MISSRFICLMGLLLVSLPNDASASSILSRFHQHALSSSSSSFVDCQVETIAEIGVEDYEYRCKSLEANMVYNLPESIQVSQYDQELIRIHGVSLDSTNSLLRNRNSLPATLKIAANEKVQVESLVEAFEREETVHDDDGGRYLSATSGTRSVLVIRMETSDGQVSLDASTLSNRIFGSQKGTPLSLMKDCSMNKLQLTPAHGSGVVNGVVDVSITSSIRGQRIDTFENEMIAAAEAKVGSLNQYDHYIICVPSGSKSRHGQNSWRGYAEVTGPRIIANDENCGYLGVIQHELGHNLGLAHSGLGSVEYNDLSGMMGFPSLEVMKPLVCFNGAKNWQLGFFQDKSLVVQLDQYGPWKGPLYGFTDYNSVSGNVLLRVGNYIIQYNKITDINRDTPQKQGQVAVTLSTTYRASVSWSKGGLNAGGSLQLPLNGKTVVIQACSHSSQGDYFDISIHYSTDSSMCGSQPSLPYGSSTSPPVSAPTFPPFPSPTSPPTFPPIPSPTSPPTNTPTSPPTNPPVAAVVLRTLPPTVLASSMPSEVPTSVVSMNPTRSAVPSWGPSSNPSSTISPMPSVLPSMSPSSSPSFDTCDDARDELFSYSNGTHVLEQKCMWLSSRKDFQEVLCVEGESAYDVCEETCGKCHDTCTDTAGSFEYRDTTRPCSWLMLRPWVQDEVCHLPSVNEVCPETCNLCDTAESIIYP